MASTPRDRPADPPATPAVPISLVRVAFGPPQGRDAPSYFHALDLLRGLAALAILFWHYVHFFFVGSVMQSHDQASDPLYPMFRGLYEHGGNAVQLFWLISGFTFAAVYTRRPVDTRTFAVHRFARLYPLHLLTLLVVAGLQLASLHLTGRFTIYDNNDLPHLIDQLLLTSGWGPTIRFSFNGPIWTVSVEVLVYGVFWALLPRLFTFGLALPVLLAGLSFGVSRLGLAEHVFQGGFFFFGGCALYPLFLACRAHALIAASAAGLPIMLGVALLTRWHAVGPGSTLLLAGSVLAAAAFDVERLTPGAVGPMRWLGDNTYGTYLWHVPIQISILLVTGAAGLGKALFLSPVFLLSYLALVVFVARLSFLYVERPSRAYLNARFSGVPAAH